MKTLYIVRHAKSDKDNPKLEDIDRPLNQRGYTDAHAMATKINDTGKKPDLIISSPAVRALTTALIFARTFKYNSAKVILDESLYETGTKEYLDVIAGISHEIDTAMIFGHNSTITTLVNKLTEPFADHIPTCAVTAISFPVNTWTEVILTQGKLVLFDFPKNIQG
ncbi:MAG: putative phosphohistidine phosphatase, SixA [Bacteroidota bacterium]|jgi:phosphohistidine phosphatase|nr:putative phosphohistidine phosphatase, SixA [Bacteroidota bacterium]